MAETCVEFLKEMLATLDDIDNHKQTSLNEFIQMTGFTARAKALVRANKKRS